MGVKFWKKKERSRKLDVPWFEWTIDECVEYSMRVYDERVANASKEDQRLLWRALVYQLHAANRREHEAWELVKKARQVIPPENWERDVKGL